jgi:hypothetical protein
VRCVAVISAIAKEWSTATLCKWVDRILPTDARELKAAILEQVSALTSPGIDPCRLLVQKITGERFLNLKTDELKAKNAAALIASRDRFSMSLPFASQ